MIVSIWFYALIGDKDVCKWGDHVFWISGSWECVMDLSLVGILASALIKNRRSLEF